MSDAVLLSIVALIGLIVKDFLDGRRAARSLAAQQVSAALAASAAKLVADKAALKVSEVKATLVTTNAKADAKLEEIKETGTLIHVLVNNSMSMALKSNAALARRLAHMTGIPADVEAAEAADKALADHTIKQDAVDRLDAAGKSLAGQAPNPKE